jgi:hypothetical protein
MKNVIVTTEPVPDISAGDSTPQITQAWHLATNGNPHFCENFPRLNNGPARCRLRKPFEKHPKN